MTTVQKIEFIGKRGRKKYINAELRGLSTDTKPTQINNDYIDNGSVFIEIDTGKIFFYDLDNNQWKGE